MGKSRQVNVTAPLPPRRRWTENTMAARHRRSTREKDPQVRTHLALPARAEMHLHAPRGSTPTQASPARSEIDHKPCRRTGPDRALSRDSGDRPSSSKGVATGLTPPRRCGDRPFRFLMNARQDRVPPHRRRYTSHRNHGGPLPVAWEAAGSGASTRPRRPSRPGGDELRTASTESPGTGVPPPKRRSTTEWHGKLQVPAPHPAHAEIHRQDVCPSQPRNRLHPHRRRWPRNHVADHHRGPTAPATGGDPPHSPSSVTAAAQIPPPPAQIDPL